VSFDHKPVVVRSLSNNPSACVIDCDAAAPEFHHAFVIDTVAAPGVVLEGISLTDADGHMGGAVVCHRSSLDVVNCLFYGNFATYGGGMFIADSSVVSLTGCVFTGNEAVGDGAVSFYGKELSVSECGFYANRGLADGPGAVWVRDRTADFDRCVFVDNWTKWDGGAMVLLAGATITNCTFVRNTAEFGDGSAISMSSTDPVSIKRSIFAFNGAGTALYGCPDSLYLGCCDFYGNAGGDWHEWMTCLAGADTLNGNFGLDPLFCDTLAGDYTLAALSPCLPQYNSCQVLIGAYGMECREPTGTTHPPTPVPQTITLHACPNPFNPRTSIVYTLPAGAYTTLRIYDVRGRRVQTLVSEFQAGGPHRVLWDGQNAQGRAAASGVYFLRVQSSGISRTAKLLLLK
jgi:hypothetical protein